MTKEEYRTLRKRIGSQAEVAKILGVHPYTISKRERGVFEVTSEAGRALKHAALEQGVEVPE